MKKYDKETLTFIDQTEDKAASSSMRQYLKSKGVICTNLHLGQFQCLECNIEWNTSLAAGGRFKRGYGKCPNKCN